MSFSDYMKSVKYMTPEAEMVMRSLPVFVDNEKSDVNIIYDQMNVNYALDISTDLNINLSTSSIEDDEYAFTFDRFDDYED
jgi:uncharacterized beta-barrel protein YwiB (DUF1934 family)